MSRRIVMWVGVVTLALVCLAIAILVRANQAPSTPITPTPSPTASPVSKQQTLLISVRASTGLITGAVTLGTEDQAEKPGVESVKGSWLSMQPALVVDADQDGQITIADQGPDAPVNTGDIVGNQLGFEISNVMVLDRLAFAALVDAVTGVTVNVRNGTRKLFGPAAADYVITLNPGESPANRLERFNDVLRQVIVKLPSDVDRTRSIVASLGSSSRTSGSTVDIANVLVDMRAALLDSTVATGMPQADAQKSGGRVVYVLVPSTTVPIIRELFIESVLVPGFDGALPRVRVYAAGVTYEVIAEAGQALADIDQTLVWGGTSEPAQKSAVYVPYPELRPLGIQTAAALKLPASVVQVDAAETIGVQVAVRLASDSGLNSVQPSVSAGTSQ